MFECYELRKLREDYLVLNTPQKRKVQLYLISQHRKTCVVCNGSYQTAGLKQLHEQAYAGTWGNGKR